MAAASYIVDAAVLASGSEETALATTSFNVITFDNATKAYVHQATGVSFTPSTGGIAVSPFMLGIMERLARRIDGETGVFATLSSEVSNLALSVDTDDTSFSTALASVLVSDYASLTDAYESADSSLAAAYSAADSTVTSSYESADTSLAAAYSAADSTITANYESADSSITSNYQSADSSLADVISTNDSLMKETFDTAGSLIADDISQVDAQQAQFGIILNEQLHLADPGNLNRGLIGRLSNFVARLAHHLEVIEGTDRLYWHAPTYQSYTESTATSLGLTALADFEITGANVAIDSALASSLGAAGVWVESNAHSVDQTNSGTVLADVSALNGYAAGEGFEPGDEPKGEGEINI
jgi:hypothetical protein